MSYVYKRWLFNVPENTNFSFEEDSNDDGLADGLTDVSGTHSITQEGIRFHIQETDGEFYLEQTIDNTTNYRIYFDYKVTGTVNMQIKRYDNTDQLVDTWQNVNLTSTSWDYKEYAYTANASVVKLRIYFSCNVSSDLSLDNLAIIENASNVLINPTGFNYDLVSRSQAVENVDDNVQFIEPYKNKYTVDNIVPVWGWLTYTQKEEVEALINEKILIRTHDRRILTVKVMRIGYGYEHNEYELDQKYSVRLELKFF